MKPTIEALRAHYWGHNNPKQGTNNQVARGALLCTRNGGSTLKVVNPLALALARVNFDSAQAISQIMKRYAASPEARRDMQSKARAQMAQANANLKEAYGVEV